MRIADIQGNQGKINIQVDVIEKEETRTYEKFGKILKVANAIIRDDSGACKLTLWNDEIAKVNKGDKVEITNGYARQYKDEIQLTAGKFGQIKVVGKMSETPEKETDSKFEDPFDDTDEW